MVTTSYSDTHSGFFNVGLPTTITSPGSVLKLDYDAVGRPVKQTRTLDSTDYVVTRTYDSAGFLRGLSYPDGDSLSSITYDAAGRLKSVPGVLTSVTYNASGQLLVQTNANGTATTKTYSPTRGFLTDIDTVAGSTTIQDLHYTLDPAGIATQVTSPFANEGWSYAYDDLYRMTTSTNLSDSNQSQTFSYDAIGRITSNSRIGIYTYPNVGLGRPHAPATAGSNTYSYDNNGNLETGAGRTLTWDANNRIKQAAVASTTVAFLYDGAGTRLKKSTSSSNSLYPFGDDYQIVGGIVTKYLKMEGLGAIARRVGSGGSGQTFWQHTDRLGSIQAITDGSGALVQRRTYRPYGEKIADSTGHVESEGWIGERNDAETGLQFLHARYYDPALGTFLSPDRMHPASRGVGTHRYGYGLGRPASLFDPWGLCSTHPDGSVHCEDSVEVNGGPGGKSGGSDSPNGGGNGGRRGRGQQEDPADSAYDRAVDRVAEQRERARQRQQGKPTPGTQGSPSQGPTGCEPDCANNGNTNGHDDYFRDEPTVEELLSENKFLAAAVLAVQEWAYGGGPMQFALTEGFSAAAMAFKFGKSSTTAGRTVEAGLAEAIEFLGPGYKEVGKPGSGVFVSADGLRQFRMTERDILGLHGSIGPHFNFETFDASGRKLRNVHMPLTNP